MLTDNIVIAAAFAGLIGLFIFILLQLIATIFE